MPTVSVIVPVYNVERYVADAIASVLAQTWTDFELLAIDDGSSDRSAEIIRGFSDPRIRLIAQSNRGLAGARNAGIRHARGRYLAFLDSDDLWHPEKLARHLEHLEARPEVGVSYCPSEFIDDEGRRLGYFQSPKLRGIEARDVLLRNPVGNGSAPVIRRETFAAIRYVKLHDGVSEDWYFDESFRQSEDIECWMRIALTTPWRFEGIAEALTLYRVNAGGLSANLGRQLATWERALDKARAVAPDFVARWGSLARAFQLRYLARRAVRLGDSAQAIRLARDALAADRRMLREEPVRTVVTLAAVYAQALMPAAWYRGLERLLMSAAGLRQRLRERSLPATLLQLER